MENQILDSLVVGRVAKKKPTKKKKKTHPKKKNRQMEGVAPLEFTPLIRSSRNKIGMSS